MESEGPPLNPADLVGVWELVAFHDVDADGGGVSEGPLGPDPVGLLIYTPDGYMAVSMMRSHSAAGAEKAYMGYAGTWRLAGNQSIHRISLAEKPVWVGTEQVRDLTLGGNILTLYGTDATGLRPQRRVLQWRRAAG